MKKLLNCSACGSSLKYKNETTIICQYCGSTTIVPNELRKRVFDGTWETAQTMEHVMQIGLRGDKDAAIKAYRKLKNTSLNRAKTAVEQMLAPHLPQRIYPQKEKSLAEFQANGEITNNQIAELRGLARKQRRKDGINLYQRWTDVSPEAAGRAFKEIEDELVAQKIMQTQKVAEAKEKKEVEKKNTKDTCSLSD